MNNNLIFKLNACLLILAVVSSETLSVEEYRFKRHVPSPRYSEAGLIQGAASRVGSFFGAEKNIPPRQVETVYGSPVLHNAVPNTIFRGNPSINNRPVLPNRLSGNAPYKNAPVNAAATKGQGFHSVPSQSIPLPIRNRNTAYKVHRYNGVQVKSPIPLYPIPTTTTTTEAPAIEDGNENLSKGIFSYLSSIQGLIGTKSTLETIKAIAKIVSNKDGLRFIANFIKSGVISKPQISVQLEPFEENQSNKPPTSYGLPSNMYGSPFSQVPSATYGVPSSANGSPRKPANIYKTPIKTSTSEISGSLISSRPTQNYVFPSESYGLPPGHTPGKNNGDSQSFELPKVSTPKDFYGSYISNNPTQNYGPPKVQNSVLHLANKPASTYGPPPNKDTSYVGSLISSRPANSYVPPEKTYGLPAQTHSPPAQTYGLPTQTSSSPAQTHAPPVQIYGPSAHTYSPPARTYSPPIQTSSSPAPTHAPTVQTYGPPEQTSSSPAQTYETPIDAYSPPAQTYGPPVRSYGPPAQEYGIPLPEYDSKAQYNTNAQDNNASAVFVTPAQTDDVDFNKPQGSVIKKPIVIYEVPSTPYFSPTLEKDNISSIPSYDSPITSYGVPISTSQINDIFSPVNAETTSKLDPKVSASPELPRLPNLLELSNISNPEDQFEDSQPSVVGTKPVYGLPSKDFVNFSTERESQTSSESENLDIIVVEEPTKNSGVIKTTYEAPGYSYTQYKNVDIDNEASSSDISEAVTTLEAVQSNDSDSSEMQKTVLTAVPLIIEREPALSSNTNNIMTINRNRKRWQS